MLLFLLAQYMHVPYIFSSFTIQFYINMHVRFTISQRAFHI